MPEIRYIYMMMVVIDQEDPFSSAVSHTKSVSVKVLACGGGGHIYTVADWGSRLLLW